jgi:hypothetical protein
MFIHTHTQNIGFNVARLSPICIYIYIHVCIYIYTFIHIHTQNIGFNVARLSPHDGGGPSSMEIKTQILHPILTAGMYIYIYICLCAYMTHNMYRFLDSYLRY